MEVPLAETAVRARPVPPILPPAKAATCTPAKAATFSVTTVNVPRPGRPLRATILPGARSALGLAIFPVTREIGVVGGLVAGGFIVSVPHARNGLPSAPVMSERG
jgi:hypothetical protein